MTQLDALLVPGRADLLCRQKGNDVTQIGDLFVLVGDEGSGRPADEG